MSLCLSGVWVYPESRSTHVPPACVLGTVENSGWDRLILSNWSHDLSKCSHWGEAVLSFISQLVQINSVYSTPKCILDLPSAQAQATISCPLGHLLMWPLHLLPIYSLQSMASTIFLSLSSVQDPCFDSCKVFLALLMKYDSSRRMHSLPWWSRKFCLTPSVPTICGFQECCFLWWATWDIWEWAMSSTGCSHGISSLHSICAHGDQYPGLLGQRGLPGCWISVIMLDKPGSNWNKLATLFAMDCWLLWWLLARWKIVRARSLVSLSHLYFRAYYTTWLS